MNNENTEGVEDMEGGEVKDDRDSDLVELEDFVIETNKKLVAKIKGIEKNVSELAQVVKNLQKKIKV